MTSSRASGGFIAVTGVAIIAYFIASGDVQALLYDAIGISAVAAVLAGIRIHRPTMPGVWYLLALGLFLLVLGDLIFNLATMSTEDYPFPSISDAFYLLGNLTIVVAGVLVIRARSRYRDIGAFIDATILATTATFLAWKFYMRPFADDPTLTGLEKAVSLAYPAMMTLMFAVGVRLLLTRGQRTPSFVFMLAAIGASLLADVVYAELALAEAYYAGHPIDLAYLLWYVFWAAAALHPSMTRVTAGSDRPTLRTSNQRILLLVGAVLLVPVTTVITWWRGDPITLPVFVAFSSVLFLFVLWRMRHSIQLSERAYIDRQLALDRERVLHDVASGLAVSSTRADAFEAVTTSLGSIMAGRTGVQIALVEGRRGTIVSSSGFGDADSDGPTFELTPRQDGALSSSHGDGRVQEIARAIRDHFPQPEDGPYREIHVVNPDDEPSIVLMLSASRISHAKAIDLMTSVGALLMQALHRIALVEDIGRRKNLEFFHSLVRNSSDVTLIIEAHGMIRYVSPAAQAALGFSPGDLQDTRLGEVIHPEDTGGVNAFLALVAAQAGVAQTTAFRMKNAQNTWLDVEATANNLLDDPDVGGLVLNVHDITVRKRSEAMLEYQAFHDALTSLPNRALFLDRLEQAMKRATSHGERVAVLFIDLDRFKFVNDSLGHDGGDALLIMASQRIRHSVSDGDTVARLGGDEFTVVLTNPEAVSDPLLVVSRLGAALSEPYMIKDRELVITASIGVALSGPHHERGEDLLREADIAMYQAKSDGRNSVVAFHADMGRSMETRVQLEQDLRRAFEHDEFVLYYQPEVDLRSGKITSFEALVRWQHPERGMLYPDEFIPLAEESGLITRLGQWTTREACRQTQEWRDTYPWNPVGVSVNVAPQQLLDHGLVDDIMEILRETRLPSSALRLEITETTLMREMEASLGTLRALRKMGIQIAIDDFGHGYSSLGYLRYLPLDVLKLDKSFLRESVRPEQDDAIIQAVATLAHSLDIRVTAEGIESANHLRRVRLLACDLGQGFYFAKPRDAATASRLIESENVHEFMSEDKAELA